MVEVNETTNKKRSRVTRWDDAPKEEEEEEEEEEGSKTKKSRSGVRASNEKAAALQKSIKERLAALKRDRKTNTSKNESKRAKIYDVDLSVTKPQIKKRQIKTEVARTSAGADISIKKEESSNPYLLSTTSEKEEEDQLDTRIQNQTKDILEKKRQAHRREKGLQFVTPGSYIEIANKKRAKAEKIIASGYLSGRKEGTYIKSIGSTSAYTSSSTHDVMQDSETILAPRFDSTSYSILNMPYAMEWWDVEFLSSKYKKQLVQLESEQVAQRTKHAMNLLNNTQEEKVTEDSQEFKKFFTECYENASLSHSKTSALIQHPVPIKPHNYKSPANTTAIPTIQLTKRELKRQRKLRRAQKARDMQDMQAAGIIPPPEPRLTLSNFMKVIGEQAVLDPSQVEQKVLSQISARKEKHLQMNLQRSIDAKPNKKAKKQRKIMEDAAKAIHVAIFYILDISHVYHRTKVDLNAIQSKITGCILECEYHPTAALCIAEGGPKAIKRFMRLMLVRMKWNALPENYKKTTEDDTEVQKSNPNNKCALLWNGMSVKRSFSSFLFQSGSNSESCRKILQLKGCAHYWDQLLSYVKNGSVDDESSSQIKLNLLQDSDDEDEEMKEQYEDVDQNVSAQS